MVVELHTGELFRAALELWVASSAEPHLRERVVPLEARIGRQVHRATVQLLGVDDGVAGVRELIQATLDMARGLGLANLLTDDRRRREPDRGGLGRSPGCGARRGPRPDPRPWRLSGPTAPAGSTDPRR